MTARRIDQGMAAAAARALGADGGREPEVSKELRTRFRQLRAMLHTAGLAATYAFIASKAGGTAGNGSRDPLAEAYRTVEESIRDHLAKEGMLPADAGVARVLLTLGEMNPVQYARASAEATALVGWLSRLADAAYQERAGDA
jgi:CRISPR type III-B/RAMP module-associated protein Cmr5